MDPEVDRVRKLARLLDTYAVDPIVGLLLPGAGDLITSVFGLYTVSVALQRKVSPVVIARMLLNLALDALLGAIPLAGDLFDFVFKANEKNVELLVERSEHGGKASAKDWLMVVLAALLFVAAVALPIYLLVSFIRWIA
jgi:hypothetical protein